MKNVVLAISLLLATSVLAAEKDAPSKEPETTKSTESYSLFDLMRFSSHSNSSVLSEDEAFAKATIVVRGYIDSITEGRTIIQPESAARTPMNTSLFKVEVTDVIKGQTDKFVYFEYVTGGMRSEYLEAAKFDGEVLLYLTEVDYVRPIDMVTNSKNGLMNEVTVLYCLVSEELFFIDNQAVDKAYRNRPPATSPNLQRDSNGAVLRD